MNDTQHLESGKGQRIFTAINIAASDSLCNWTSLLSSEIITNWAGVRSFYWGLIHSRYYNSTEDGWNSRTSPKLREAIPSFWRVDNQSLSQYWFTLNTDNLVEEPACWSWLDQNSVNLELRSYVDIFPCKCVTVSLWVHYDMVYKWTLQTPNMIIISLFSPPTPTFAVISLARYGQHPSRMLWSAIQSSVYIYGYIPT